VPYAVVRVTPYLGFLGRVADPAVVAGFDRERGTVVTPAGR
jgi:hypothetical protein